MAKMVKTKASTRDVDEGPSNTTKKSKVLKMKTATPDADAPKAKKAKTPAVRKFVGKTTGMSIKDFQNKLMKSNFKAKLTDEQLAKAMRDEFPNAIAKYTVGHVRGIRSAWNKGKHGNEAPERQLPEFDAQGNVVKGRTRVKKEKAAPPAKSKKAKPRDEEDEEEVEEDDESEEDDSDEEEEEDE